MIDVKCKGCNRLLAKTTIMVAAIKCPRCKMIFEYKVFTSLHVNDSYDIIKIESKETSSTKEHLSIKR